MRETIGVLLIVIGMAGLEVGCTMGVKVGRNTSIIIILTILLGIFMLLR